MVFHDFPFFKLDMFRFVAFRGVLKHFQQPLHQGELHRQGIEIILDVVFNHTAEGAPEWALRD